MPDIKHKRRYFAALEPIPHRTTDEPLVCLQVNTHWIAWLLSVIEPGKYPETWLGTLDENRQARRDVQELITNIILAKECTDMATNPCCGDTNIGVQVQVTVNNDGTITQLDPQTQQPIPWQDDPRILTPVLPPKGDKCDAATNAREHLMDVQADIYNKLLTVTTIGAFLLDCIVIVLEAILIFINAPAADKLIGLVALIVEAVKAWYTHTPDEFNALFTQQVWDDVLCLLYCNVSENGTFTQSQFNQVLSDCLTKITGGAGQYSAAVSIYTMIRVWQVAGLNTAASYGAAAGADCSDCDCPGCLSAQWTVTNGVEVNRTASYVDVQAVLIDGTYYAQIGSPNHDTCCCMTREAIVGEIDGIDGFLLCGTDTLTFNLLTSLPIWGVVCSSTTQFTVRFHFPGCA